MTSAGIRFKKRMFGPGAQVGETGWEVAVWVQLAVRYLRTRRRAWRFRSWLARMDWRRRQALAVEAGGGAPQEGPHEESSSEEELLELLD